MQPQQIMQRILQGGIVPAIRTPTATFAMEASLAVMAGGINVLELPVTVPGALDVIRQLTHDQPELVVGAGTVLDAATARMAILAGAMFIVSPSLHTDVITCCRRYSVPVFAGALTPTEIVAAWQGGADVVKVFPASALGGASYIKAVLAPLPNVRLMPMGGVNLDTVTSYLEAGALLLGVGGDMVDNTALASGNAELLTTKARAYVAAVSSSRQNLGSK